MQFFTYKNSLPACIFEREARTERVSFRAFSAFDIIWRACRQPNGKAKQVICASIGATWLTESLSKRVSECALECSTTQSANWRLRKQTMGLHPSHVRTQIGVPCMQMSSVQTEPDTHGRTQQRRRPIGDRNREGDVTCKGNVLIKCQWAPPAGRPTDRRRVQQVDELIFVNKPADDSDSDSRTKISQKWAKFQLAAEFCLKLSHESVCYEMERSHQGKRRGALVATQMVESWCCGAGGGRRCCVRTRRRRRCLTRPPLPAPRPRAHLIGAARRALCCTRDHAPPPALFATRLGDGGCQFSPVDYRSVFQSSHGFQLRLKACKSAKMSERVPAEQFL